jgi:hypothetical protein
MFSVLRPDFEDNPKPRKAIGFKIPAKEKP